MNVRRYLLVPVFVCILSAAHAVELFHDGFEDGTLNAWSSQLAADVSNIDDGSGTNRIGQIAHVNTVRSGLGNQGYAGFSELQFEVELRIRALSLPAGGDAMFVLGREYYSAGLQQTYALDIDANSSGADVWDEYRIVINNDTNAVLNYDGGSSSVAAGKVDLFQNGSLVVDDGNLATNNSNGVPSQSFGFIINGPELDMTIQFDDVVIRNFKAPHIPTNYVVSTTGNDLDPGTLAAPFRTISHAVSLMDVGDTLWIRGGTYHEAVSLNGITSSNGSPFVISAYSNETVILSGMQPISGDWSLHSGDIYKTTVSNDIWQLLVDGEEMVPARWPNAFFDDSLRPTVYSHDGFEGCTTFSENGEPVIGGDGDVVLNPGDLLINTNGNVVVRADEDLPGDGIGAVAVMNIGSWWSWARTITEQTAANEFTFQPQIATNQLNAREQVFFLEGKLDYLDAQTEWFYDQAEKTVYLWQKGGGAPSGMIEGKAQSYAFTFSNCTHIELRGIDFYGTTFRMENCVDALVEDCDFDFPHTSRRMLGEPEAVNITSVNADRDEWLPSRITLRNCTMRETDGPAIEMRGYGNTIENCSFERIDWTGAHGGDFTFGTRRSPGLLFRRNTVRITGASEGVGCPKSVKVLNRNGDYTDTEPWMIAPYVTYEDLYPSLLELNRLSEMGKVQSDGGHLQAGSQQIPGLMYRYNWAYSSEKNGLRFDGGGGWGNQPPGVEGSQHHNVVSGTRKQAVKGDRQYCFNNTCFDSIQQDIYVGGDYPRFNAFNTRSKTGNNACNKISYSFNGENGVFPGEATNNYIGGLQGLDVKTLLVDPGQFDFRPKAGTPLVDGGVVEHGYTMEHFTNFLASELFVDGLPTGNVFAYTNGITDDYMGSAPDMGAYEYGSPSYWIPGRQTMQTSHPIPADGAVDQPTGRDLIYLIGYKGIGAQIYFGTETENLARIATQSDPTNVVEMAGLERESRYYWRVDTVLADSSVVTGEVWSFTTETGPSPGEMVSFDFSSGSLILADPIRLGTDAGDVQYGEWFAGADWYIRSGCLDPASNSDNKQRTRGAGNWLDTSTWPTGTYTASFVVTNFVPGGSSGGREADANFLIQQGDLISFTPGGGSISSDLRKAGGGTGGADWSVANGASVSQLGSTYEIISNGVHTIGFSITSTTDTVGFFFVNQRPDNRIAAGGDDNALEFPRYDIESFVVHALFLKYASWADGYGLTGNNALATTDIEPDGLDNLLEYALGGNPTHDDAKVVLPVFQTLENGFHYIHNERTDNPALTYTVEQSTNLVSNVWKTNGVELVGEAAFSNHWKKVTNSLSIDEKKQRFMRLRVEEL